MIHNRFISMALTLLIFIYLLPAGDMSRIEAISVVFTIYWICFTLTVWIEDKQKEKRKTKKERIDRV